MGRYLGSSARRVWLSGHASATHCSRASVGGGWPELFSVAGKLQACRKVLQDFFVRCGRVPTGRELDGRTKAAEQRRADGCPTIRAAKGGLRSQYKISHKPAKTRHNNYSYKYFLR